MSTKIVQLAENIFDHIFSQTQGNHKGGILLSGDPGIGKTAFLNFFAKLLGLEVIVIEVPHITEEHVINIPFIVINPTTGKEKAGTAQLNDKYELILSESNLLSQIKAARQEPDAAYLQRIQHATADVKEVFAHFGGNDITIPPEFAQIRNHYKVILFLDEFYRQTSIRIRNVLRSILNGRIGMHEIPPDAYVIYASNMKDQGLDEIPSNHQFTEIEMPTPSKEDWFDWLQAKFEHDEHIKLNPVIIKAFKEGLDDTDISHEDLVNEVRTSPRRWEQLLLYVNTSLPVKDDAEAKSLLTNVKTNFRNYLTGGHSGIADKVLEVVAKLIKETSNIEISKSSVHEPHDWKDTLTHQIEQKMKLGEHRKYIPVVSGLPGVGKTAMVAAAAHNLNLRLVDIDVSELSPEDITGIPIPGERESEKHIAVKFAHPKLHKQIMRKIELADEDYLGQLKNKQQREAYKNQTWKYLIFFDELNRTDERTFNALRRVLLEKNFGPTAGEGGEQVKNLELPMESIVVAAINPEGIGTTEFTHHVRDVMDIIDAKANWGYTLAYLKQMPFKDVVDNAKKIALKVITVFVKKFKTKQATVDLSQRPYHLDVGGDVYVSPREYSDLYSTLVMRTNRKLKHFETISEESELRQFEEDLKQTIFDSLKDSLGFIFKKHSIDGTEFFHDLDTWVKRSDELEIGENITFKKAAKEETSSVFSKYVRGAGQDKMVEDMNVVNFMNSTNISQVVHEISELLQKEVKDAEGVKKYILDQAQPKWSLKGTKITKSTGKASILENFILALLFTLHVHEYSNERLQAVWKALNATIKDVFKSVETNKMSDAGLDINAPEIIKPDSELTAKEKDEKQKRDKIRDEMTAIHTVGIQLKSDIHDAISEL